MIPTFLRLDRFETIGLSVSFVCFVAFLYLVSAS
jgi:hypothetical protein